MHVRPCLDWIVVRIVKEEKKPTGIVLVGAEGVERIVRGVVLRTGPGRRHWSSTFKREVTTPTGVRPGDTVAFFRENFETQEGQQVAKVMKGVEEGTGLVRADAILWKQEGACEQ